MSRILNRLEEPMPSLSDEEASTIFAKSDPTPAPARSPKKNITISPIFAALITAVVLAYPATHFRFAPAPAPSAASDGAELTASIAANRGGVTAFYGGETEKAAQTFAELAQKHPNNGAIRDNLGVALRHLGRAAEAKSAFDAALAIDPTDTRALNGLARLRADRGKFGEAEALFTRSLATGHSSPEVWLELAHLAERQGHWSAAEGYYGNYLKDAGTPSFLNRLITKRIEKIRDARKGRDDEDQLAQRSLAGVGYREPDDQGDSADEEEESDLSR